MTDRRMSNALADAGAMLLENDQYRAAVKAFELADLVMRGPTLRLDRLMRDIYTAPVTALLLDAGGFLAGPSTGFIQS